MIFERKKYLDELIAGRGTTSQISAYVQPFSTIDSRRKHTLWKTRSKKLISLKRIYTILKENCYICRQKHKNLNNLWHLLFLLYPLCCSSS